MIGTRVERDVAMPSSLGGRDERGITAGQRQLFLRVFGEKTYAELPNQVFSAYKQYNAIIREHLRTETALRLATGDDRLGVPVHVVDGMPAPFAQLLGESPDPDLWALGLKKPLFMNTLAGLHRLRRQYSVAERAIEVGGNEAPACSQDELGRVLAFVGQVVKGLGRRDLRAGLTQIEEDVLGAYFFRWSPEVRLYWFVIGAVSAILGVSVEALTVVVLAHELAHTYTHLGRDIDGVRWDTPAFAGCDLRIVEGLAQYYAGAVCERLKDRQPAAKEAYQRLLKIQAGPYTVHKQWVEDCTESGEIIRHAMIHVRSSQSRPGDSGDQYDQFDKLLSETRARLRPRAIQSAEKGAVS